MSFDPVDFEIENGLLKKYCGDDVRVSIPDGVKAIGEWAFARCSNMEEVTIPDSVVRIERSAFDRCTGLKSVTLPPCLTRIGEWAFSNCSHMKSITIPAGVTEIPRGAFCRSGLEQITLPPGVQIIGYGAFMYCSRLRTASLPEGLTVIGKSAFEDCKNLKLINLPDSLVSIEERAFRNCRSLNLADEPNCVAEIDEKAFHGATPTLEARVKAAARRNHTLESACIATVTSLRRHKNADELLCAEINGHTVIVDKTCRKGMRMVYFPVGCRLDDTFAREHHLLRGEKGGGYLDPVRRVVSFLRLRGERSEGLALPVEWLKDYTDTEALKDGDRFSVLNGHRICRTVIPDSMDISFTRRVLVKYHPGQDAPQRLFLPLGLEVIEDCAFIHCRRLVEVIIPETVTRIGRRAFYDCPDLERVEIHNSDASIGEEAFVNCGSLRSVVLPKEQKVIQLEPFLSKDYVIQSGKLVRYNGDFPTVVIPEGVTEIGNGAFMDNGSLERVVIPEGVDRIGYRAFRGCRRLGEVSIPDSVKSIGEEAFFMCRALRNVTVPPGVEQIGEHAFGQFFFFRYISGTDFPYEEYRNFQNFCMYCKKGSAAETYALKNHLNCSSQT